MASATPIIIGIGGGSGCGKTYLANAVREQVGTGVACLSMDQYFKTLEDHEDPRQVNFDHPKHLDIPLLVEHLRRLKAGEAVRVPSYDFHTMIGTPEAEEVPPEPVLVVEGLFVLSNPIRPLLDLGCFLDVEADQRLLGRLLRDLKERPQPADWIIERYQRFIRPCYRVFVEPSRENADIIVDFTYRRSFFTLLLIHIIRDYVAGGFDMPAFLKAVEADTFRPGSRPDEGAMPQIPDILELSKAFP